MSDFIDLQTVFPDTNSPLWQVITSENETVLQVTDNLATTQKTGTAAYPDEEHQGKVALIGPAKHNYRMQAEMRFFGHHHPRPRAGWFGFVIRAQDFLNFEIVWFMPNAETGNTAAYVPVAHGIVPWWSETYANQKKGSPHIPVDEWFRTRIDVSGDEFTAYVEEQPVFTKKITYYLKEGRPGFFVGTATDAGFRRITIEDLP